MLANQGDESIKKKSRLASLAVIGIGVDMVFVPRIRQMIMRHAKRISRTTSKTDVQQIKGIQFLAAQEFARRIMHSKELDVWMSNKKNTYQQVNDSQIQQLAKV